MAQNFVALNKVDRKRTNFVYCANTAQGDKGVAARIRECFSLNAEPLKIADD
jgi:hypothetical protein